MSNLNWVESVDVKDLSNKSVMLLSRFARALKKANGSVLKLTDNDVLKNAVTELKVANDESLYQVFQELAVEVKGVDLEDSNTVRSDRRSNVGKITYRGATA